MRFKTIFLMANSLASSNTALLDSVIICFTTVTTIFTYCPEKNSLHLKPELTDLISVVLVGVRPQGPRVPLWRDLPPDVPETAVVPLSCLGVTPLCFSPVSHPLKTVLRELNRKHLVEGFGCRAKRLVVTARITVCLSLQWRRLCSLSRK
jgi:hypothetical protein